MARDQILDKLRLCMHNMLDCLNVEVCDCVRRIADHLEKNLPNLDTLILTGNNLQELCDIDALASVTNLTTLRFATLINVSALLKS